MTGAFNSASKRNSSIISRLVSVLIGFDFLSAAFSGRHHLVGWWTVTSLASALVFLSFFLSFFLFYQTGRPILVDSSDMKLELGWKSPRLYFHVFISWMWGPVRIDSLVVRCRANWCMSYRFSSKKLLLKHSVSPSIFFLVQFFSFLKKELCWRVTWLRFGGLEKTNWNLFEPRCLSILTENETIVHESISARNWNAFAGR